MSIWHCIRLGIANQSKVWNKLKHEFQYISPDKFPNTMMATARKREFIPVVQLLPRLHAQSGATTLAAKRNKHSESVKVKQRLRMHMDDDKKVTHLMQNWSKNYVLLYAVLAHNSCVKVDTIDGSSLQPSFKQSIEKTPKPENEIHNSQATPIKYTSWLENYKTGY